MFIATLLSVSVLSAAPAPQPQFDFGQSLEGMHAHFDQVCETWEVRHFDPPQIPFAQESHAQVDCQGYDHAGAERLAEFVFVDGQLGFVWVLIEEGELAGFAQALDQDQGEPTYTNATFRAYTQARVALRYDVPEFLYYSRTYAPMFEAWFAQNG